MPWCPDCGCEYREDVTSCADCGSELTNEMPAAERQKAECNNMPLRKLLELAGICTLVPWLWYFLLLVIVTITKPEARSTATDLLTLVFSLIVALAVGVAYFCVRKLDINVRAMFDGWVFSMACHFLVFVVLALTNVKPRMWLLVEFLALYAIITFIPMLGVILLRRIVLHMCSSHQQPS